MCGVKVQAVKVQRKHEGDCSGDESTSDAALLVEKKKLTRVGGVYAVYVWLASDASVQQLLQAPPKQVLVCNEGAMYST